jgi:hypothetical protein
MHSAALERGAEADPVFASFLASQAAEGRALAEASDILRLEVWPAPPPHFLAEFACRGLVREAGGAIRPVEGFRVGIYFPPDYLRRSVSAFEMLRLYTPGVWHPNASPELPVLCIGRITPGTGLVEILHRIFELLSYQRYNAREPEALNKEACAWVRQAENRRRFPIDPRPLRRRQERGVIEL